jgi:mannose-1-phosphate guanylyltransferase/phosphomannomutase
MTNWSKDLSSVPALIIAGGKGTRLGLSDLPKPMAPVLGKPLLEYQIELIAAAGIKTVYILSGFLAEKIIEYFGDGSQWGIRIEHIVEDVPLGTAGAIKQMEGRISGDFFVFYGDVYVDMDLQRFYDWHSEKPSTASIVVHPNDHPYDSDLVDSDKNGDVRQFISKPHDQGVWRKNSVNAALYILTDAIFEYIPKDRSTDFGKNIFPAVVESGKLIRAYNTPEFLKDMGTPERLKELEGAISSGKTAARNIKNKQRAIFLDRDGIINDEIDGVFKPEDFELTDDIVESLKMIHKSDYLAIVVTNQPFLAKGFMTVADLDQVHAAMDTKLGKERTFVDALYYCPHHPEKGWDGEIPELKIECDCRKPKPGMLLEAARDFNIDLTKSYIIGDRTNDTLAGKAAGLKASILIDRTGTYKDSKEQNEAYDRVSSSVKDAVAEICKE